MPNTFNTWHITHTDTFGGEANFCWKREYDITTHDSLTRVGVIRRAKAELGWSGLKCNVSDDGYGYTITPNDRCEIAFIEWSHSFNDNESTAITEE